MKPILNQVLFKPFPSEGISENGIIIPETARQISNKGTIISVGEGTKNKPMRLKEGDICYRVKDWGLGFSMNGEIYFLMDEKAIIATE